MPDTPLRIVSVEIQGQRYPVRSSLDAGYVARLATYVDAKMQAAAEETASGDSLRIAVLAALNIADEFFRCQSEQTLGIGLLERAGALEALVDRALDVSRDSPQTPPMGANRGGVE